MAPPPRVRMDGEYGSVRGHSLLCGVAKRQATYWSLPRHRGYGGLLTACASGKGEACSAEQPFLDIVAYDIGAYAGRTASHSGPHPPEPPPDCVFPLRRQWRYFPLAAESPTQGLDAAFSPVAVWVDEAGDGAVDAVL